MASGFERHKIFIPMDRAIGDLSAAAGSGDTDSIVKLLDAVANEAEGLSSEEIAGHSIDHILKQILRNNRRIEVIEKIGDLLLLVRDPRNFQDELVELMEDERLVLPTLMLMYQMNQDFGFEYDGFYQRLVEVVTGENVQSEGFLLFMVRCLGRRGLEFRVVEMFLRRLSGLSTSVLSRDCIKIVYCMLVIMRMHPACFALADDLKELSLLACSFGPIKGVVQRIYIEAEHPQKRPKMVFLENFAFPELEI